MSIMKQSEIPHTIYLQLSNETWCEERINDTDVEYIYAEAVWHEVYNSLSQAWEEPPNYECDPLELATDIINELDDLREWCTQAMFALQAVAAAKHHSTLAIRGLCQYTIDRAPSEIKRYKETA